MKKLMTFAVFAALIGWSQQIDSVTVRQRWPWSKLVDINYVLTAPVGARVAHAMPTAQLKKVFACLLYGVAAYMLWKAFNP